MLQTEQQNWKEYLMLIARATAAKTTTTDDCPDIMRAISCDAFSVIISIYIRAKCGEI